MAKFHEFRTTLTTEAIEAGPGGAAPFEGPYLRVEANLGDVSVGDGFGITSADGDVFIGEIVGIDGEAETVLLDVT